MTVGQLIDKLQKLPKDLPVYHAAHDNSDWEVQGKANSITFMDKSTHIFDEASEGVEQTKFYNSLPQKYIIIGG